MKDFHNVWVWGNPLLEENRTYAPYLENHTSYLILAQITRQMFYETYNAWLRELFRAQVTIDELMEFARLIHAAYKAERDVKPYIARQLNQDEKRVGKVLLFLDIQAVLEMVIPETIKQKVDVVYSEQSRYPAPTASQIQSLIASSYHPCACGFEGCIGDITGRFWICSNCYRKLGSHIESEWDELTRKWLPKEIRRIRSQAQRDARNLWYKQQYTEISQEELEQLEIAA
jgi:hypothetical protein